jgi:PAS domain S-box-containing protein
MNVAPQEASNEEPRSSLAPLMAALESNPLAAAIFEVDDWPIGARIVFVNRAHERLTGYRADQLVGHSSMLLAGARPDPAHVAHITRADRRHTFATTTRKHRPDGTSYEVREHLIPIENEGRVTHVLLLQRALGR